jgi:hypothetical protein
LKCPHHSTFICQINRLVRTLSLALLSIGTVTT